MTTANFCDAGMVTVCMTSGTCTTADKGMTVFRAQISAGEAARSAMDLGMTGLTLKTMYVCPSVPVYTAGALIRVPVATCCL
jgi:hypothetical protein